MRRAVTQAKFLGECHMDLYILCMNINMLYECILYIGVNMSRINVYNRICKHVMDECVLYNYRCKL